MRRNAGAPAAYLAPVVSTSQRNRLALAWSAALIAPGALIALAASFWWTPEGMAAGGPLALLGIEREPCAGCPLCGMSRAFCAFSHLRLAEAIDLNAGVLALYPLAWLVAIGGPAWLATMFLRR